MLFESILFAFVTHLDQKAKRIMTNNTNPLDTEELVNDG